MIGNFTEKWTVDLLTHYAELRKLYAIQGVVCEDIGLTKFSQGDVVLCKKNSRIQKTEDVVAIFEVKMSLVWNWEFENNQCKELGEYTSHQGEPGLLRSDSMLKAIGKIINIRVSGFDGNKIPIIVLKNSYFAKVDHLKKCGIIQGFWSVNPNPLEENKTLKNTQHKGFIQMNNYDELVTNLDKLLHQKLTFFSSMKSKRKLGEIIVIANKENDIEKKAEKFLELIKDEDD